MRDAPLEVWFAPRQKLAIACVCGVAVSLQKKTPGHRLATGLNRHGDIEEKRGWGLWHHSRRGICFIFLALGLVILTAPAVAVENGSIPHSPTAVMAFNIPSQPLEDALYAFDAVTGIEVFVDGLAIAGRRSSAVNGSFTPAQALRTLLNGTGLDAKQIGSDTVTVVLDDRPPVPASSALYHAYSAFVQNAVVRALCDRSEVRPGNYRVAMRLWLDPSGVVSHADLLSSTGNSERDLRIRDILSAIPIGVAPPPKLPQPIIIVILPRSPSASGDCAQ